MINLFELVTDPPPRMSDYCTYCAAMSISHLADLAKQEFLACRFPRHAFYQHHRSFLDLEESALRGCKFCSIVLKRFHGTKRSTKHDLDWPDEWTGPQEDVDSSNSRYAEAMSLPSSEVSIAIGCSHLHHDQVHEDVWVFDTIMVQVGPQSMFEFLSLTITALSDKPFMLDGYHRVGRFPLDPNLGSPANHSLARDWLKYCETEHPNCTSHDLPKLPTRVIDVGSIRPSRSARVFLSEGKKAHYVALSHCWGGAIPTVLQRTNLEAYQAALPFVSLPANFQDAITITRELGIQYLWIDSLCIVQDSEEDWEKESKTMCDVYRSAFVTISAMSSWSSTEGILKRRSELSHTADSACIKILADDPKGDVVRVELETHDENLVTLERKGALSQRGWVLQESLLSRRQLIYGQHQIFFTCLEGLYSADGTAYDTHVPPIRWPNLREVLLSTDGSRLPASAGSDTSRLLDQYYSLVRSYSLRKLTYDSDKLPAFSAVGQLLHPVVGGHYLAGLWSNDFNRGLLWYHAGPRSDCKHVRPYRAPSWSWAVTNGHVVYTDSIVPSELDLRLLRFEITLCDENNSFGRIAAGYVVVNAIVAPFVRSTIAFEGRPHNVGGSCDFDELTADEKAHSFFPLSLLVNDGDEDYIVSVLRYRGEVHEGKAGGKRCEVDVETLRQPSDYVAMVVCNRTYTHRPAEHLYGLVLRRTKVRSEDVFERVGMFTVDVPESDVSRVFKHWERTNLTLI